MNKFLMDQPPRITEGKIHYYNRARTEASRSALIEVLRALESYSDHLVLVGGWAPYYILKRFSKHLDFQHCGSIDIDLVLDPTLCKPTCYKKILKILSEEDYQQHLEWGGEFSYKFSKNVGSPLDGREYNVELDFITEPSVKKRHKGLIAAGVKGSNVALDHSFKYTVTGFLPEEGEATVEARIADLVGCLTMKGIAMKGRRKEKDAYDAYTLVKYFREGPTDAAGEFQVYLADSRVREGLNTVRENLSSSPKKQYSIANFISIHGEGMRETVRTDVSKQLGVFFDNLPM